MNEMNMWGQPTNMPNRMRDAGMQGTQSFDTRMVRPSYLPGRLINNPNDVRPNEVPMDGSPSVFLLNDASGILVKWWNADGQLCTQIYTPQSLPQDGTENGMSALDFQTAIFDRLDKIEKQLKRRPYQKNTNNYKKKEGKNDA